MRKQNTGAGNTGGNAAFAAGLLCFFGLWLAGAYLVNSEIVLPAPAAVIKRFFALVQTAEFYKALGASFARLMLGLVVSIPPGIILGIAAATNPLARAFLRPFFTAIASTPVMSVILIAYLAFGSERTPAFTVFLLVFPVISSNTIEGIRAIDPRRRELFTVYRLSRMQRLRHLYLPALRPFLAGALGSALSLGWKVIVAAEVLVQPLNALGTGIQRSKANLETPELFAWTLAVIIAAAITTLIPNLYHSDFGKTERKRDDAHHRN
ncbi:MAG: ABC transporter permease subunit [Spirochaetaceae bacterium]|nr:ABC transporter permease subunit [Spirochaetaceae bacterium]